MGNLVFNSYIMRNREIAKFNPVTIYCIYAEYC